jgi:ATP-binding cassette subfamily F protein uup
MLSANGIKVSFDDRVLFEDLGVGVDAGDRLALVGINGVGKSTLLRILAGQQKTESGRVDRKSDARVGYLDQQPRPNPDLTAHQAAGAGLKPLQDAIAAYEEVSVTLSSRQDDALLHRQAELLARIDALGGFGAVHRVDEVLTRLGVREPQVRVGDLSGGGQRRVALAALMVERPEILLLDEPTNHLDMSAIAWLRQELVGYEGAVIFITHDRAFLDAVATRVAELADRRIYVHGPTYADYLEGRMDRMELQERVAHKRDRLLARELAWLRAGTPARTTKQQARIKRAEELLANEPEKLKSLDVKKQSTGRLARTILELQNVTLAYGTRVVLKDLSFIMVEGMRLGVVGPNGAGKTTLLKAVLGELAPDTGKVILGGHTQLAYFDQHRTSLNDADTVRDAVTLETHVDVDGRRVHLHGYLEGYLFNSDDLRRRVKSLSGGERNRLLLARLMLKGANLLVMDEPTNDLDHDTLGVLEEILLSHAGCALISSHDQRFLDRVATHILALAPDGTSELFAGNHEMYLTLLAQRTAANAATTTALPQPAAEKPRAAPPAEKAASTSTRKLSFKEQKELEGMEAAILAAEGAVETLQAQVNAPDFFKTAGAGAKEILTTLEAAQAQVAALYARWEDLESRR